MSPTKQHLQKALTATKGGTLADADTYFNDHGILSFGVERVRVGTRVLRYVNLGDTYTQTIASENGVRFVTSWGEWLEQAEEDYCADNDVIRCGYCGLFTPLDSGTNWRDCVCEVCGNKVGG